ncbi:hypothetical protein D4R86_00255 [bacterium]|nr:MAG: hypothetical protein D4R86_00255 [bacterium]
MKTPTNSSDKINIPEARFWELVELAKWPCETDKMKIKYLVMLSKKECAEFRKYLIRAYGILDDLVSESIEGVGDDGYSDLLYHIIGLGEKEFYRHAHKPSLIQKRANSGDYKECFSYCVPYDGDYDKNNQYTSQSIKTIATQSMKEIEFFDKMDNKETKWLTHIRQEMNSIEMLMQNFLDNQTQEGLEDMIEYKVWLEKATKRIDKFFEKNYRELPRKFTDDRKNGSNYNGMCTAIFNNTVSDAEIVLEYLKVLQTK